MTFPFSTQQLPVFRQPSCRSEYVILFCHLIRVSCRQPGSQNLPNLYMADHLQVAFKVHGTVQGNPARAPGGIA